MSSRLDQHRGGDGQAFGREKKEEGNNRLEQERKRLEREKQALEEVKKEQAVMPTKAAFAPIASYDGIYGGQLCNKFPNKTPFCLPVTLVVSKGIAEGNWVTRSRKKASVDGIFGADGIITLNLEGWTPRGDPVRASIVGCVDDGTITVSGQWPNGPEVSGDWKRTP